MFTFHFRQTPTQPFTFNYNNVEHISATRQLKVLYIKHKRAYTKLFKFCGTWFQNIGKLTTQTPFSPTHPRRSWIICTRWSAYVDVAINSIKPFNSARGDETKAHCNTGHSRASLFLSLNQGNGHISGAFNEAGLNGLRLESTPSALRQAHGQLGV